MTTGAKAVILCLLLCGCGMAGMGAEPADADPDASGSAVSLAERKLAERETRYLRALRSMDVERQQALARYHRIKDRLTDAEKVRRLESTLESDSKELQNAFNSMVMFYTEFDLVLATGLEETHPLREKVRARLDALVEPVRRMQLRQEMLKTGKIPERAEREE